MVLLSHWPVLMLVHVALLSHWPVLVHVHVALLSRGWEYVEGCSAEQAIGVTTAGLKVDCTSLLLIGPCCMVGLYLWQRGHGDAGWWWPVMS